MASLQTIVDHFLAQKRVAVVGVRTSGGDVTANIIYKKFRKAGYEVFPVNPNASEFEGGTCYASVKDIPGGVDLAMLVTRPEITEQVVRECHEAGIRRVWMHRSFGNSSSEAAVAYCIENEMAVLPGGCPMMFIKPVDVAHVCMRFIGKLSGWMPREMEMPLDG